MLARFQQYVGSAISQKLINTYHYFEQKAHDSYKTVSHHSYLKTVNNAILWLSNTHNMRNLMLGFLQPVTHMPEATVQIKKSNKIRHALLQTSYSTAPMLLISFTYYRFLRPAIQSVSSEDGYEIVAMDTAVTLYLSSLFPRFKVQDTINTAIFSEAIAESVPHSSPHFNCGCGDSEKRRGDFNANVNFLMHSVLLDLLSNHRYIGPIVDWVINPWFLGQTFLDYRLNMCDTHRYQQVEHNNFFLIGVGASTQFTIWALQAAFGAHSQFATFAIRAFVMKLGMLTTALREEPLPGNEYPFDSTYYLRFATTKCLQDSTNRIYKQLKKKQADRKTKGLLNEDSGLISKNAYHLFTEKLSYIVSIVIGKDFATLDSLVCTNEIRLLIQLKEKKIKNLLSTIKAGQKHKFFISAIDKITGVLPTYFLPSGVSREEIVFFKRVIYLNVVEQCLPVIANLVNHALQDPEHTQHAEAQKRERLLLERRDAEAIDIKSVMDDILNTMQEQEIISGIQGTELTQTDEFLFKRVQSQNHPTFVEINPQQFFLTQTQSPSDKDEPIDPPVNLAASVVEVDYFSNTAKAVALSPPIRKLTPDLDEFTFPTPGRRPSTLRLFKSELKSVKIDVTKKLARFFI